MTTFLKIRKLVKTIPKGRVSTYGAVARATRANPLVVGWAMHGNKDISVPCHRVVFKDGSLAPGYAFGGEKVQKQKLQKEGVRFTREGKVKPVFFVSERKYKLLKPAAK